MQLGLFDKQKVEYKYRWEMLFDWMPTVGELAEFGTVILPEYGYVYMAPLRVTNIDGEDVTGYIDYHEQRMAHANGRVIKCKKSDLWPPVYADKKRNLQ